MDKQTQKRIRERLVDHVAVGEGFFDGVHWKHYQHSSPGLQPASKRIYQKWEVSIKTTLEPFENHSQEFKKWSDAFNRHGGEVYFHRMIGILEAALQDLDDGFLSKIETMIASEMHTGLLAQAAEMHKGGHQRCAAVLIRVAVEDAVKRFGKKHGIDHEQAASGVLADLKKQKILSQNRERSVQAILDLGNDGAHPGDPPDAKDVGRFLKSVNDVLAFLE